jgi:hypothetical protein
VVTTKETDLSQQTERFVLSPTFVVYPTIHTLFRPIVVTGFGTSRMRKPVGLEKPAKTVGVWIPQE